jgi:hypothetical protein
MKNVMMHPIICPLIVHWQCSYSFTTNTNLARNERDRKMINDNCHARYGLNFWPMSPSKAK